MSPAASRAAQPRLTAVPATTVATRSAVAKRSYEPFLFHTLVAAQLLPLGIFRFFPNWDGPAHVGAAAVIAYHGDPAHPAFGSYFALSAFPTPNLAGHLLLVALVPLFGGVLAEKILVGAILVLWPLALRYAVGSVDPRGRYLGYLGLPLALGWFVHAGQYNFCLGLASFLLTVGYWIRHADEPRPGAVGALSGLLVLTYFCHIATLLAAVLFLLAIAASDAVGASRGDPRRRLLRFARRGVTLGIAFLPAAVLVGAYALHGERGAMARLPFVKLVAGLATLAPAIVVFDWKELPVGVLLVLTVVALGLDTFRKSRLGERRLDGVVLLVPVTVVLYLAVPDSMAGGSFLSARLSLLPYLAALLWMAQCDPGAARRRLVVAVAVIASVTLLALRLPAFAAFDRDLAEYLSFAPRMRRNATVLPLFFKTERTGAGGTAIAARTRPLDTAAGYLMADRGIVDLSHYESAFDYFPTRFRPALDPYVHLATHPDWQQELPPKVDFLSYEQRTPGRVDYVMVWGMAVADAATLDDPATASIRAQLDAGYRLVYVSEPRALLQVYERRG